MNPITVSVTPALKVNVLQYDISGIDPPEDYSLVVARTTQDGYMFELPFMVKNTALSSGGLSKADMEGLKKRLRAKVEAKLAEVEAMKKEVKAKGGNESKRDKTESK